MEGAEGDVALAGLAGAGVAGTVVDEAWSAREMAERIRVKSKIAKGRKGGFGLAGKNRLRANPLAPRKKPGKTLKFRFDCYG